MPVYTIYNTATGAVLAQIIGRMAFGMEHIGDGIYEGDINPNTHYINPETGEVEPRPAMPSTPGTTELEAGVEEYFRVDNIPEGTLLKYPGDLEEVIDDGFFEWTTDLPGTFEFTLELFPYQPVTYHATFSET